MTIGVTFEELEHESMGGFVVIDMDAPILADVIGLYTDLATDGHVWWLQSLNCSRRAKITSNTNFVHLEYMGSETSAATDDDDEIDERRTKGLFPRQYAGKNLFSRRLAKKKTRTIAKHKEESPIKVCCALMRWNEGPDSEVEIGAEFDLIKAAELNRRLAARQQDVCDPITGRRISRMFGDYYRKIMRERIILQRKEAFIGETVYFIKDKKVHKTILKHNVGFIKRAKNALIANTFGVGAAILGCELDDAEPISKLSQMENETDEVVYIQSGCDCFRWFAFGTRCSFEPLMILLLMVSNISKKTLRVEGPFSCLYGGDDNTQRNCEVSLDLPVSSKLYERMGCLKVV